jgi:hypothetical protein
LRGANKFALAKPEDFAASQAGVTGPANQAER